MPKFVFVEPLKPRQRKQRSHEIQALDREAALKELARSGITEFESAGELPPPLIDPITLQTAELLSVGVHDRSTRLEAAVSVLMRISDIGRVAELVIGLNCDGEPYRAYFKAIGVEDSPKGIRVKGMALVAPPDPEVYTSGQREGMRKWLAEEIEQVRLAPENVEMPDPAEYGRISFTIRQFLSSNHQQSIAHMQATIAGGCSSHAPFPA